MTHKELHSIPVPPTYTFDSHVITKAISAGLSIIDPEMRIVWHNKFFEGWFGPICDLKGRHCYEIYEKRSKMCMGCPVAKVFKYGYDHCTAIRRGIATKNSGRKRCFKLSTSPIKDEQGKIVQVMELVEDVTEQIASDRMVRKKLNAVTKELDFIAKLDKEFITMQDLSLDKVLQQCVEIAQGLLGSRICNLRLIDGAEKLLVSKAHSGLGPSSKEYLSGIRIGEGIVGKVAETKTPMLINDLQDCKYTPYKEYFAKEGLNSAVVAPIMLKNEVLGTLAVYEKKISAFTKEDCKLLSCFANHVAILIDNIKTHKEVFTAYIDTIKSLVSAVEARDSYTRGHSEKVTKFALDIARVIGISEDNKMLLTYCGRLHDIGKIGISDMILNKPGPLSVSERAEMQLHPVKAVQMLSNLKFLERGIPAIKHHHERYDGRGYPDGLKGTDIPLMARILGCADSFDAMTSDRAYRPRMNTEAALAELKVNRGKQFDPEIVNVFIDLIENRRV